MTLPPSAFRRCAIRPIVACLSAVALTAHAQGDPPPDPLVHRHDRCVEPAFRADDLDVSTEPGGYGIDVRGERHWIALDRRTTFALRPADGGNVVAQVKVDRPPEGSFDEQLRWRRRWLEDVAARAGVLPLRQTLPGDGWLLNAQQVGADRPHGRPVGAGRSAPQGIRAVKLGNPAALREPAGRGGNAGRRLAAAAAVPAGVLTAKPAGRSGDGPAEFLLPRPLLRHRP